MTEAIQAMEFFFGDSSHSAAKVYLRLPPPQDDLRVKASIRGPYCRHSATLPATIPLRDAGPGESVLMTATIPDPCFWTPDLPAQYDLRVEWRQDQPEVREPLRQTTERVGVRMFGAQGSNFREEGKRRVLRAIRASSLVELPHPSQWRETGGSLWCPAPPEDSDCREASEQGIRLLVDVPVTRRGAADDAQVESGGSGGVAPGAARTLANSPAVRQLVRLRRHAAVTAVCLGGEPNELDFHQLHRSAPNLLLGARIPAAELPACRWDENRPDFLVVALTPADVRDDLSQAEIHAALHNRPRDLPILLERPLATAGPFPAVRQQCDRLQSDTAALGNFAGYIV